MQTQNRKTLLKHGVYLFLLARAQVAAILGPVHHGTYVRIQYSETQHIPASQDTMQSELQNRRKRYIIPQLLVHLCDCTFVILSLHFLPYYIHLLKKNSDLISHDASAGVCKRVCTIPTTRSRKACTIRTFWVVKVCT